MNENKQQPLLFTVAEYKELNSLSSYLTIGKNIERVNLAKMISEIEPDKCNDLDVICEFMNKLLWTIKNTNNVDKMSIEYMNTTMAYMELFKRKLVDRVLHPKEFDNYIQKPINNPERFEKIINLCLDLFNAIRVLVYNEADIHTVSLMTIMHIIGMMNITDEELNYDLLKLVGRFNESKASDIDEWLETIEYNSNLYYQKDILDTINDLVALSPMVVLDVTIYRLVISSQFTEISAAYLHDHDGEKPIEMSDLIDGAVNYLMERALKNLETVADIINDTKYGISNYFIDIIEDELAAVPFYQVVTEEYMDTIEMGDEENKETIEFKRKRYVVNVNEEELEEQIRLRLFEYLVIGKYIDVC